MQTSTMIYQAALNHCNTYPDYYQPYMSLDKNEDTVEYYWSGRTHGVQVETVGGVTIATIYTFRKLDEPRKTLKAMPITSNADVDAVADALVRMNYSRAK